MKRCLSGILAMTVLALSLTGCGSKPSVIATFEGGEIPAGVYILNEYNQYTSFTNYTGTSDLNTKITEEETLEEVIEEDALAAMKSYAAVESECRRLGIELPEEDVTALKNEAAKLYKENKETYEKKGIGLESLEKTGISNALSYKLMEKLYGKDGELEVSLDEKNEYLNTQYRKATVLDMPLRDAEGSLLEGDAKDLAVADAEDLYNSILNGEKSFAAEFKRINSERGADVPETDDEKNYSTLISTNDTRFSPDFTVSIFADGPEYNKPLIYKAESSVYIYELYDVTEDNFAEALGSNLIYEMKRDDFMDYLAKKSEEVGLTFDESALKAYGIKKIVER